MIAGKLLAVVVIVKLVTSVPEQKSNSHKDPAQNLPSGCDEDGCPQEKESHLLQKPELQATNITGEAVKARVKGCRPSKKCSKLSGSCVKRGTCIGVTSSGCNQICECCIPVETTAAPCPQTTCPTINPVVTTAPPPTIPNCPEVEEIDYSSKGNSSLQANVKDIKCPKNWDKIGGCCYLFVTIKDDWAGARQDCIQRGDDLKPQRDANLAEACLDTCNTCKIMEHVVSKVHAERLWFGARGSNGHPPWKWERTSRTTGRELSIHSNMWYYDEPNPDYGNCLVTWPGHDYSEVRAYFGNDHCCLKYGYVCQIF